MSQTRFGIFTSELTTASLTNKARVIGSGISILLAAGAYTYDISVQAGLHGFMIPSEVVALSLASASLLLLAPDQPMKDNSTEEERQFSDLLYRGYHGAAALLTTLGYVTDAKAAAIEYVPDIAIHTLEMVAPNACNKLALAANVARSGQAALAFWNGKSTIPAALNVIDVTVNHASAIANRINNLRQ